MKGGHAEKQGGPGQPARLNERSPIHPTTRGYHSMQRNTSILTISIIITFIAVSDEGSKKMERPADPTNYRRGDRKAPPKSG